jgi:hypothetical protein
VLSAYLRGGASRRTSTGFSCNVKPSVLPKYIDQILKYVKIWEAKEQVRVDMFGPDWTWRHGSSYFILNQTIKEMWTRRRGHDERGQDQRRSRPMPSSSSATSTATCATRSGPSTSSRASMAEVEEADPVRRLPRPHATAVLRPDWVERRVTLEL